MATPHFNRLALAAALLEYDNDPEDRYGDNVDHKKSAIFRGVYNRPPVIPPIARDGRPIGSSQSQSQSQGSHGHAQGSQGHASSSGHGHGPAQGPGQGPSGPTSPDSHSHSHGHGYGQGFSPVSPDAARPRRQTLFGEPEPENVYAPHAHLPPPGLRDTPAQFQMSGPYPIVGAPLIPTQPQQQQRKQRTMSGSQLEFGARPTSHWIPDEITQSQSMSAAQRPGPTPLAMPQPTSVPLAEPPPIKAMSPPLSSPLSPLQGARASVLSTDLGGLPDVRHSVVEQHVRRISTSQRSEKGVMGGSTSSLSQFEQFGDGSGDPSLRLSYDDAELPAPPGAAPIERPLSAPAPLDAVQDRNRLGRPEPVMVPLPSSPPTSPPASRPMSGMGYSTKRPQPPAVAPDDNRQNTISIVPPKLSLAFDEESLLRNPFEYPGPTTEFSSSLTGPRASSVDLERRSARFSVADNLPSASMRSSGRRGSLTDDYYAEGSVGGEFEEVSPQRPTFEDIPTAGDYGRPLRPPKYGAQALRIRRQELLRPKTLIMPSMLAGTEKPTTTVHIPEGFTLGEKPLPADARASILNMGMGVPLSLAQRTFRSSLMVGGRREDELFFHGQAEEGEIYHGAHVEDEPEERLPGKLYGTSLIDQLEARKNQLRNKKRVFYGDHRPSMMTRNTEAAQEEAPPKDNADGLSPPKASLSQRPSTTFGVPTLNVPAEEDEAAAKQDRLAKSRSVFGVDTVWEREMAKLKAIQEAEKKATNADEMERLAFEREKIEKADRRRTRFLNKRATMIDTNTPHLDLPNPNRMSVGIPDLAAGPGEKRITMLGDNRKSMFELHKPEGATAPGGRPATLMLPGTSGAPEAPGLGVETWFGSSDGDDSDSEDDMPLSQVNPSIRGSVAGSVRALSPHAMRKSTHGPISPSSFTAPPPPQLPPMASDSDDDEEDDVPLSRVKATVYDSDEEAPLSRFRKPVAASASASAEGAEGPTGGGNTIRAVKPSTEDEPLPFAADLEKTLSGISADPAPVAAKDDDEDDVPLYVRRQRAQEDRKKEQTVEEIEDDLPLAWKHAGAAQKQQLERSQRPQQSQSMMMPNMGNMGMNPYGSPYMSSYGMPGMPMSGMGMGGMGMGGMGGMGMPGHMSMMMPNMPYPSSQPPLEVPDPGSNIDNWRKQVGSLAQTGSGQTVSSRP